MAQHGHRRQVLLFLVAIILPCAVLVVLGLRMVGQERELRERRVADERQVITSRLQQELANRLERAALREASALIADPGRVTSQEYESPAVALVASVADGRLALPWEQDSRSTRFRRALEGGEFARLIGQAERAELAADNTDVAIDRYSQAVALAGDPVQASYARLLRGRALKGADRDREALRDYRAVLATDLNIVDEHGVPLALYAATRLLEGGVDHGAVAERIRTALSDSTWHSPSALYLLRDLVDTLQASADSATVASARGLEPTVSGRLARTEQAIALQRDVQRLGLGTAGGKRIHNTEARWVPYGTPAWLVGFVTTLGSEADVVVAVWADSAFAAAEAAVFETGDVAGTITIASGDASDLRLLGASFPGLGVRFPPASEISEAKWDVQRWFYLVALLLVVSVTLFGAYLVSRDVRRELRLAETRSRFVSAVSHELKTPLTAIRMFAETLQLGRSSDPVARAEYLETIVNESERLTRLLNNVLDFSKIERGKKVYSRQPNCLAEIVRASARAMQYPLEQQQFTLNVEVQDGMPTASVDRDAIEQALLNLMANAMKYSGGSREIGLRLRSADGQAVIEVADHGVGIHPDEQAKIFEQFYRVQAKENAGIPGTGLGLTLVRHIAEGHGGHVTVESARGKGSTFAIHLPLDGDA